MKDIPGIDEDGNPKNGPFKLFFKNGLVSCEGEFDNGKKSGKWKYFLNNGQMQSSGSFKDGKIVGRWKWFYKNGELRGTGGFDDEEQKHGVWKRYHPNGQLWDEGRFRTRQEEGHLESIRRGGQAPKDAIFQVAERASDELENAWNAIVSHNGADNKMMHPSCRQREI